MNLYRQWRKLGIMIGQAMMLRKIAELHPYITAEWIIKETNKIEKNIKKFEKETNENRKE